MTDTPLSDPRPAPRMRPHDGLADWLAARGYSPRSAAAMMEFDISYFQWFRIVMRGEFRDLLLHSMDEPLDPAAFQGLTSVARIATGLGRQAPEEPTIGLVAEEMCVDPSRASRIVADLVARDLVERGVAQEDARKAVLRLTPKGIEVMRRFRDTKWGMLAEVFDGWTEDEIDAFSTLFRRYAHAIGDYIARERAKG
jgi:DNA-binding MarR family transcriptional regulator